MRATDQKTRLLLALISIGFAGCGKQPPAEVVDGYELQRNKSYYAQSSAPALQTAPVIMPKMQEEYEVQQGDTLEQIAIHYDVTPEQIMARNHTGVNVQPGQVLAIPEKDWQPQPRYSLTRKEIQDSPVLSEPIEEAFTQAVENTEELPSVVQQQLAQAKQDLEAGGNIPDEKLDTIEPAAGGTVMLQTTHRVSAGENLFRIGLKYGVSALDLMAYNDIPTPQSLQAGMVLKIPSPDKEVTKTKTSTGQPTYQVSERIIRQMRSKGLIWPVDGQVLNKFGAGGDGVNNTGISIKVPKNTPVVASENGTVIYSDSGLNSYGNLILIRHANGLVTAYAHNDRNVVKKDQKVKKGDIIAFAGDSGNVGDAQLYFEVRRNARAVDPIRILPRM